MLSFGEGLTSKYQQFTHHFNCSSPLYPLFHINQIKIPYPNSTEQQKMNSKQSWRPQEDAGLKSFVQSSKKVNWNEVAISINTHFPNKYRTSKQCRQRYINYSSFSNETKALMSWTSQDINILFNQFEIYGSSWTRISQSLPGKSENSIKNKFYGSLRKVIRRINGVGKNGSRNMKKKLRFQSIIRVIQAYSAFHTLGNQLKEQSKILRSMIFDLVKNQSKFFSEQAILELIDRLNKFNLITRSYKAHKPKRGETMNQGNSLGERQRFEKKSKKDGKIEEFRQPVKDIENTSRELKDDQNYEQLSYFDQKQEKQIQQIKIEPKQIDYFQKICCEQQHSCTNKVHEGYQKEFEHSGSFLELYQLNEQMGPEFPFF